MKVYIITSIKILLKTLLWDMLIIPNTEIISPIFSIMYENFTSLFGNNIIKFID